jgi:hypothetical protein
MHCLLMSNRMMGTRMSAKRTWFCLVLGCILLGWGGPARADNPGLAAPTKFPVEDERFAALAKRLEAAGWDFDQIFAELCRTALANAAANPKLHLEDEARSIWGGLWLWTRRGGAPLFQAGGHAPLESMPGGRIDHGFHDLHELQVHYAQHFIAGGMFEAYFDLGREAGVTKERVDAGADDYFDFNKVAVTTMGARWVDLAVEGDAAQSKRWLELWATGQYTLSKSMPKLHWGHLPPGVTATRGDIRAVEKEVEAAMPGPPDVTPAPAH